MFRGMVTVEQKDYVDRGVQTDLARRLSRPESFTSKPINPRVYDPPAPHTPPTALTSGSSSHSPSLNIAYSHSPTSGGHPIPVHAAGPTRSPPTSRKHPQLPYSRPSQLNSTTQRVLSLPETSPPYSTQLPRETRGVSLSERPRASLSFSDNTIESSGSAETSFLSENRSGSSRARRSFPSSDMPHTPSPPSSPESVMIIGNDMQVPISFLRQKVKASKVYEDDGGWISWASSPPKPIPALHGPLSLPYARCPSGAEGTIIEGEDLSRMIWGLGIEDASSHSRTNTAHFSHKSTPQSSFFPPRQQVQRHSQYNTPTQQHHNILPRHQRQTSHDRPHDRPHPPSVGGSETRNQILLHQRALESLGPRHSARGQMPEHGLNTLQNSDSWTDIYRAHDVLGSPQDQLSAYDGQRGLGLDWQETLKHQHGVTAQAIRTKSPNALKPSAPIFVPASQQAAHPRIFVEPRIPHTINPPQRLTAIEIAHQYRAQHHPQSSLPTPPGSSSPQWAPFLSHYTDPFPPLDLHRLLPVNKQPTNVPQHQLMRELQQSHSDPSQELRQFVFDRMRKPDLNVNHDYLSMSFDDSGLMDRHQPLTPHVVSPPSQYRKPTIDMSPPHPGPPPNSPLPPIPTSRTNRVRNFMAAPPSPTSPDTRVQNRNLTRQPRSVPFARLLQRRLSSVPEEESGPYMEPYSPPPSPKAANMTRLPRPPSFSLADSFRSRSHPGSRQRDARTPSPARDGFAPQTRTAAELEHESRWTMPSAARAKATVKLPLKTTNSDTQDSREGSTKNDGSAGSESTWEKENGKPRKKVRTKKTKGGNSDRSFEAASDTVSPWLAASLGVEAWL